MASSTLAEPLKSDIAPPTRLMSIDALRGFDMFWIIGGDALVHALQKAKDIPASKFLAQQLDHKDWDGFAFYDLIFPLFVFIAGVSIVFAISKSLAEHGRAATIKKILFRTVILYLIGLFYYGGFSNFWPNVRVVGVLQRIALCYGAAGILFCLFKPKTLAWITGLLLFGYWGVMASVPIRDVRLSRAALSEIAAQTGVTNTAEIYYSTTNYVKGKYEPGYNVSDHADFQHLPGRKHDGAYDPEGMLSTIPAIGTCLLGVFAGLLLRSSNTVPAKKVMILMACGAAAVILGFVWGNWFPVVKKIWTSSFVLVAGGYSALLLAAFYCVVDVWKKQWFVQPFVWIGANAITLYLMDNLISLERISNRFVGGPVKRFFEESISAGVGELVTVAVSLLLFVLIARFLYRRKIFLKI